MSTLQASDDTKEPDNADSQQGSEKHGDVSLLKEVLERTREVEAIMQTFSDNFKTFTSNVDDRSQFWATYMEEAAKHDNELIDKYKNDMDMVILFATLFSAVVASFLSAMLPALSPNPTDTTNTLLTILIQTIDNSTLPNQTLSFPQWNGPSHTVVYSQTLGYASLSLSLLAALGSVLGKQWLTHFSRLGIGTDEERGRRRQRKLDGLKTWRFEFIIEALPGVLHVSLLLFGVALSISLWGTNRIVGWALGLFTAVGGFVYIVITVLSLLFRACPFHTPLTIIIRMTITTAVQSIGEVAEYLEGRKKRHQRLPQISLKTRITLILVTLLLAAVFAFFVAGFPLWGCIVLLVAMWRFVRGAWPDWMQGIIDSLSLLELTEIQDFVDSFSREPQQNLDFRSIVWILETSNHHDVIMTAAALAPHVDWPPSFNLALPAEHLCDIFLHSISEMLSTPEAFLANQQRRAFTLGRALVMMLCQSAEGTVHRHFWDRALRRFEQFSNSPMKSRFAFLLNLVDRLLPIVGRVRSRDNFSFKTIEVIDDDELIQLVRYLPRRYILQDIFHLCNQGPQSPTGREYYFQPCARYLTIVRDRCIQESSNNQLIQPQVTGYLSAEEGKNNSSTAAVEENGWGNIRRMLKYLCESDLSLDSTENEFLLQALDLLSDLLKEHAPRTQDFLDQSTHAWVLSAVTRAVRSPTSKSYRMATSALNLAVASPAQNHELRETVGCEDPETLFRYLVDQQPSGEGRTYLLRCIEESSSPQLGELVFRPHPAGSPDHQVNVEILRGDIICSRLSRAIKPNVVSHHHTDLRLLDPFLEYLSRTDNDTLREWQSRLRSVIYSIDINDSLLGYFDQTIFPDLQSHFRFVKIICMLGPDPSSLTTQMSIYWNEWTRDTRLHNALEMTRVVPVARWLLANCNRSPCLRPWYFELQSKFQSMLKIAWNRQDFLDSSSDELGKLAVCTGEWLSSDEETQDKGHIMAIVQHAIDILLDNKSIKRAGNLNRDIISNLRIIRRMAGKKGGGAGK